MIDYDPHDWRHHLLDVRGSMLKEIIGRVVLCVVWSAVVYLFHIWMRDHGSPLRIPETAHALMGGILGLLLVFRTNTSYDRFWEGRRLWGAIVNQSRNLVRSSSVWLAADPVATQQIRDYTILFVWATMHRLRGTKLVPPPGLGLPPEEIDRIAHTAHPAVETSARLSRILMAAHQQGLLNDIQLSKLEQGIDQLIDHLGGCERINNTPLPFAYMVHLRRALILYTFSLPFALLDRYAWGVIPITLMCSFILFGIEEIGVEIESPFGFDDNDLPLERICETITVNMRQLVPITNPSVSLSS